MSQYLLIFQSLMSLLKYEFWNIEVILVTFDTFHLDMSLLNSEQLNIHDMLVTLLTSQLLISLLNLLPSNIQHMFFTLLVFHFEISPLKLDLQNNIDMSSIREVSISFKSQFVPSLAMLSLIISLNSFFVLG